MNTQNFSRALVWMSLLYVKALLPVADGFIHHQTGNMLHKETLNVNQSRLIQLWIVFLKNS